MVKYYFSDEKGMREVDAPKKNCWIHLESPTVEEIQNVVSVTNMPEAFLRTALDEEEAAHLDSEDDAKLVVIDIPKMVDNGDMCEIFTVPLAIVTNADYFVTICTRSTSIIKNFFNGKVKNADTAQRAKLTYQILFYTSSRFLYYLRQIERASDRIQKSLARSMQNEELLQMLDLQKSLVFFSASLTSNHSVTQKIFNTSVSTATEDERDILEDDIIESKQALEMCSVYREILKSSMDAFAAVVNNNQNMVMKILTVITVILTVPMVIAGFWGMNTGVPWEKEIWGFWLTVGISTVLSIVFAVIMIKKRLF